MRISSKGGAAFTLVEVLIASTSMAMIGGMMFYVLNTGMVLFAKNTAVNVAHQQARVAVLNMEQDLHNAVSIPLLTDANKVTIAGNGPAAGISFQSFAGGPFLVASTAAAGQNRITVIMPGFTPKVGQRLCLPLHQVELDITAIGSGTNRQITLASNLPRPIETSLEDSSGTMVPVNVICFVTDKYVYVVKNGELRYFKPGDAAGKQLANNITSPTPFSIPATPLGAPYNRYVAAINLSTADHTSSSRGFKSANMFLNALVPYRAKLCFYQ